MDLIKTISRLTWIHLLVLITHTNGSNGFHHCVITCDGSTDPYTSSSLGIKIYINGVLQTLTDNSNGGGIPDVPPGGETFSIAPNKITIGRQPTNVNYMRDSKVDELSFFNQELKQLKLVLVCITVYSIRPDIFTPGHWYRMGDGDSAPTLTDKRR